MFHFGPVVGVVHKYLVVYFEGPWGESSLAEAHFPFQGPECQVYGEQLPQVTVQETALKGPGQKDKW